MGSDFISKRISKEFNELHISKIIKDDNLSKIEINEIQQDFSILNIQNELDTKKNTFIPLKNQLITHSESNNKLASNEPLFKTEKINGNKKEQLNDNLDLKPDPTNVSNLMYNSQNGESLDSLDTSDQEKNKIQLGKIQLDSKKVESNIKNISEKSIKKRVQKVVDEEKSKKEEKKDVVGTMATVKKPQKKSNERNQKNQKSEKKKLKNFKKKKQTLKVFNLDFMNKKPKKKKPKHSKFTYKFKPKSNKKNQQKEEKQENSNKAISIKQNKESLNDSQISEVSINNCTESKKHHKKKSLSILGFKTENQTLSNLLYKKKRKKTHYKNRTQTSKHKNLANALITRFCQNLQGFGQLLQNT